MMSSDSAACLLAPCSALRPTPAWMRTRRSSMRRWLSRRCPLSMPHKLALAVPCKAAGAHHARRGFVRASCNRNWIGISDEDSRTYPKNQIQFTVADLAEQNKNQIF